MRVGGVRSFRRRSDLHLPDAGSPKSKCQTGQHGKAKVATSLTRFGIRSQRFSSSFNARSTACVSCLRTPRDPAGAATCWRAVSPGPALMRSTRPPTEGARAPASGSRCQAPELTRRNTASRAAASSAGSCHAHHSCPSSRLSLDSPRRAINPAQTRRETRPWTRTRWVAREWPSCRRSIGDKPLRPRED